MPRDSMEIEVVGSGWADRRERIRRIVASGEIPQVLGNLVMRAVLAPGGPEQGSRKKWVKIVVDGDERGCSPDLPWAAGLAKSAPRSALLAARVPMVERFRSIKPTSQNR